MDSVSAARVRELLITVVDALLWEIEEAAEEEDPEVRRWKRGIVRESLRQKIYAAPL